MTTPLFMHGVYDVRRLLHLHATSFHVIWTHLRLINVNRDMNYIIKHALGSLHIKGSGYTACVDVGD